MPAARPKRPQGVIFYDGPSAIDGTPIVGIATFKTSNEKTGPLIQTWIIRSDIHPVEAINTGDDHGICGSCPMRGIIESAAKAKYKTKRTKVQHTETVNRGRACYVAVQNAPRAIYESYHKGQYEVFDVEKHARWFRRRGLRLGAYGDPVAIPLENWQPLFDLRERKESQPGYTHQWETCDQEWRKYVMASTHSLAENERAQSMGWRTFRTRMENDAIAENEIVCPASAEGDYLETCDSCGACNGNPNGGTRRSIVIIGHGSPVRMGSVNRVIELAQIGA